jgi:hypothetical protein
MKQFRKDHDIGQQRAGHRNISISPDLSLPISQDYRCETLAPGYASRFKMAWQLRIFLIFAKQVLSYISHASTLPSLFCSLVIFEIGSLFFSQAMWTLILLFYVSHYTWDYMVQATMPSFFFWDWASQRFLPRLALYCSLPNLSFPHSWDDSRTPPCPAFVSYTYFNGSSEIVM